MLIIINLSSSYKMMLSAETQTTFFSLFKSFPLLSNYHVPGLIHHQFHRSLFFWLILGDFEVDIFSSVSFF